MVSFRVFIKEKTNLKANDLKKGDRVVDINSDCKHYKSEGTVVAVKKIKGKNNTVVGNKVVYKCNNKGKNWNKNDNLEKTEIQLSKK